MAKKLLGGGAPLRLSADAQLEDIGLVAYDFDVGSVGQSVRGSSTTHAQGVQVLSPSNPSTPCIVQPCALN